MAATPDVRFRVASPIVLLGFVPVWYEGLPVVFYTTGIAEVKMKAAFISRAPRIRAFARR